MLRLCSVPLLLAPLSCAGAEVHHYYDHLDTLEIWEPRALQVPVGGPLGPSWEVTPVDLPVARGARSVRVLVDGGRHRGDVWIERSLHFLDSAGPLRVTLRFRAYSPEALVRSRAAVIASIGRRPPREPARFVERPLDQVEGWMDHAVTVRTEPGPAGRLWFAIGVRPTHEVELAYFLDDVRIEIEPLDG